MGSLYLVYSLRMKAVRTVEVGCMLAAVGLSLSRCAMWRACVAEAHSRANQWIAYFTSTENRHALPLFTSLLNVVCAYDPVGYGMPYNHLMFTDTREPLVEVALHVLCATLEGSEPAVAPSDVIAGTANVKPANEVYV